MVVAAEEEEVLAADRTTLLSKTGDEGNVTASGTQSQSVLTVNPRAKHLW